MSKKEYPCDIPVYDIHGREIYKCPYMHSDDDYVSCRDYCGLGVDENETEDYE